MLPKMLEDCIRLPCTLLMAPTQKNQVQILTKKLLVPERELTLTEIYKNKNIIKYMYIRIQIQNINCLPQNSLCSNRDNYKRNKQNQFSFFPLLRFCG